jgi:biotin carboxylase
MPRVLILSTTTGYQLRSFGDAAGELGVELMFATDRCHTLDDPWRDAAVPVRFHDEEASLDAIVSASRARAIDGVVAVGDRPVVLAARAAEALALPGNPPDAAKASAHKRLARECFARAGLPAPAFVQTTVADDIDRVAALLTYPIVIKPVGLSGSRGVIRANDSTELRSAFRRLAALLARAEIRAERTGLERDLLVEEFIEGKEYAVEGLLTGGRFGALALFDKPDRLDGPFFEETIYVTPSRAPRDVQRTILDTVQRAALALGLRHGPIHAECRVNPAGVFVLEVAARPIGGLCSRILRFEQRGRRHVEQRTLSLEHVLLRHALGEDMSEVRRETAAAAVMMIPIPRRGVFRTVRGEEEARRVAYVEDIRITAKPDQLLELLPEAGSYLGFIFARAPEAMDAEAAVRDAHAHLTFTIDPAIEVQRGR